MFAVVILGIGFIMVAAVFPVAVQQTRSTSEEAAAAELARSVVKTISSTTASTDYPDAITDTGKQSVTLSFASQASLPPLWPQVMDQLISKTDPRYACVPYFCRNSDGTLRITVVVVRRVMHGSTYSQSDLDNDLTPRGLAFDSIMRGTDGTDTIVLDKGSDPAGMYRFVAPGAYIVVTSFDDGGTPTGRIFRVATQRAEDDATVTWTLAITNGLQPGESFNSGKAAVIGRDLTDPSNPAGSLNPPLGPAQDVGAFCTFITPR